MNKKLLITFGMCCLLTACSTGSTKKEQSEKVSSEQSTNNISSVSSAPSINSSSSNAGENDDIKNFKKILGEIDLDVDLLEGFGLSNNTLKREKPLRMEGRQVDEEFNPDNYGIHHIEDEGDWNIYSSIIRFQNSLDPYIEVLSGVVEAISASAEELGSFVYEETTYELSMFNEKTGLISYEDATPSELQSKVYSYDQSKWVVVTLASWESTSYELYFEENEYTFHIKANGVTYAEDYDYPLLTDEYCDSYINVVKDENGDYLSVTAIMDQTNNDEIMREYYEMYKKEGVVYYISSEELPMSDLIQTSFVSFIDSLVISYNARTCLNEEAINEDSKSWPFFQNVNQFFWTLQVSCGTIDGLRMFPESQTDSISPKIMNTVQAVYYTYDWFDTYYDSEHIPEYPKPKWLPSFLGLPMRAIVTPNGTYEAVQENVCYIDSLAITGNDGIFYPGRDEIAGLFLEGDDEKKLYNFWSERVSALGLTINDDYNQDLTNFLKAYSRSDLFNPDTMKALCDYDYVKAHLNKVLTDYQNVFEPSQNIKYKA